MHKMDLCFDIDRDFMFSREDSFNSDVPCLDFLCTENTSHILESLDSLNHDLLS